MVKKGKITREIYPFIQLNAENTMNKARDIEYQQNNVQYLQMEISRLNF